MLVSQMHKMRLEEERARKYNRGAVAKKTPLNKEIELRREAYMREILGAIPQIVKQQVALLNLEVSEDSKNNDIVYKASNSLLDRVFGKPNQTIDLNADVTFSLRQLSQKADEDGDDFDAIDVEAYEVDEEDVDNVGTVIESL